MSDSWTWHGGGIEAARRHFGGDDWLDLSTGINPHPWPHAADMAIDWQRLPEPHALAELEAAAAAHFGVDPRHVCAVPGTEIALRLVGASFPLPAAFVSPTYRTHAAMIAGATPIAIDATDAHSGTLILANPNNPDGRVLRADRLDALLDARDPGAWLLLDEAFADCDARLTLADRIGDVSRLVIFRSFGKFFGLAGVRLGFVLGPATLVDELRASLGAWPVSAAAIAIGTAAYRDDKWIALMRDTLSTEAEALDAVLLRAGHRPIGACPLFRLIEVEDAATLFARLARHAILTRPFSDQPHRLRIGLPPSRAALARLADALANG